MVETFIRHLSYEDIRILLQKKSHMLNNQVAACLPIDPEAPSSDYIPEIFNNL